MEFYLAGEITQVIDSITWVRCASGNVLECANVRAPFSSSFIFFNFLVTFATLQNLPMTNITFDGVRVLGAESEQKASYHTCTGK